MPPVLYSLRKGTFNAPFAIALVLVLLMITQMAIFWADTRALARVEKELRKSKAHSARILASIGDAVIVTDASGRITRMNPVAEELTGWTLVEAESSPLTSTYKIYNEHTRQIVENPGDKVRRFGTVVGLANHTILERKDGEGTHIEDKLS